MKCGITVSGCSIDKASKQVCCMLNNLCFFKSVFHEMKFMEVNYK